jgi:uncharacterized NAD(P)/FAD-binding protein YdhS
MIARHDIIIVGAAAADDDDVVTCDHAGEPG